MSLQPISYITLLYIRNNFAVSSQASYAPQAVHFLCHPACLVFLSMPPPHSFLLFLSLPPNVFLNLPPSSSSSSGLHTPPLSSSSYSFQYCPPLLVSPPTHTFLFEKPGKWAEQLYGEDEGRHWARLSPSPLPLLYKLSRDAGQIGRKEQTGPGQERGQCLKMVADVANNRLPSDSQSGGTWLWQMLRWAPKLAVTPARPSICAKIITALSFGSSLSPSSS